MKWVAADVKYTQKWALVIPVETEESNAATTLKNFITVLLVLLAL